MCWARAAGGWAAADASAKVYFPTRAASWAGEVWGVRFGALVRVASSGPLFGGGLFGAILLAASLP